MLILWEEGTLCGLAIQPGRTASDAQEPVTAISTSSAVGLRYGNGVPFCWQTVPGAGRAPVRV